MFTRYLTTTLLAWLSFCSWASSQQYQGKLQPLVPKTATVTRTLGDQSGMLPIIQPVQRQESQQTRPPNVSHTAPGPPQTNDLPTDPNLRPASDLGSLDGGVAQGIRMGDASSFQGSFENSNKTAGDVGIDIYNTDDNFSKGLVVSNEEVALKIGGYIKVDYIYDFNPIDSTDLFNVVTIPIGAPPRANSRAHARQSRYSIDTRWKTDYGLVRAFFESDFFSEGNRMRLRHAYGEVGSLLMGQTWTTFADIPASPATLDFEGQVASISTRRAQARWTQPLFREDLTIAIALEDSFTIIETPEGIQGQPRTETPDSVVRLRWSRPNVQLQVAGIFRRLGFQPVNFRVIHADAWGLNFTQVMKLSSRDKFYSEILYGNGIGSFRSLPDIAPDIRGVPELLGVFGWMVGFTHEWNSNLSSNFTFAENHIRNSGGLPRDGLNNVTYLAANLIWSPMDRVDVGVEYLYGKREDVDGQSGIANRIQFAAFFKLP